MPKMEIELEKDVRKMLIEELRRYFYSERDEELSNLGAELLLDFIITKIGPYMYNKGIQDSYSYMSERIEDLIGLEKRMR